MNEQKVFVSYVHEDSDAARGVAHELRCLGFETWTYQENGVGGVSYLIQVDRAISDCAVFLLIASPQSVVSHQIIREVEQAHERQKPIVVLRLHLSHESFIASNPILRLATGTTVTLSADDSPSTSTIADALTKSLLATSGQLTGADALAKPHRLADGSVVSDALTVRRGRFRLLNHTLLAKAKRHGVSRIALAVILAGAVAMTMLPYVAGRDLGIAEVPGLTPAPFWLLILGLPLSWALLLTLGFGSHARARLRRILLIAAIETVNGAVAFAISPVVASDTIRASVAPDDEMRPPHVIALTWRQDVHLEVVRLAGLKPQEGVSISLCGASEPNCRGEQRGAGGRISRRLPRGPVTISLFNFTTNSAAVNAELAVKYRRHRFF